MMRGWMHKAALEGRAPGEDSAIVRMVGAVLALR